MSGTCSALGHTGIRSDLTNRRRALRILKWLMIIAVLTWGTHAGEGVQPVHTGGTFVTRAGDALVHFVLAQAAGESRGTNAREWSNAVNTFPIVLAAMVMAVVNILPTKFTWQNKLNREGQDAQRRWFYPSQKFRIFLKNIPDIRMRFLLGMESGGDRTFFSPGGPVWPQQWELMRKWEMRAVKFYITA